MNALGGTSINPEAEEEEEDEDIDDNSTIVPSSPLNSRRNSLAHNGPTNAIENKRDRAGGPGHEEGAVVGDDTIGTSNRPRRAGNAKPNASEGDDNDAEGRGADGQSSTETTGDSNTAAQLPSSKLSPRVAVILGVDRKWYLPLVICRALSVLPALWWGLRCGLTFLAELLRIRTGMWREGWVAIIVSSAAADWDVERRFRVTEVALAIMWVCMTYFDKLYTDRMVVLLLIRLIVLCICISFLLFHGLYDVSMVSLTCLF